MDRARTHRHGKRHDLLEQADVAQSGLAASREREVDAPLDRVLGGDELLLGLLRLGIHPRNALGTPVLALLDQPHGKSVPGPLQRGHCAHEPAADDKDAVKELGRRHCDCELFALS